MVIIVIAGLWALLAGRITLTPSLRLRGVVARIFGSILLLYGFFLHPLLVALLLKFLPISLAGTATGATICFLIANLVLMIAVLLGLAKLAMTISTPAPVSESSPERAVSTGFLVTVVIVIAGALGGYYWIAYGKRSYRVPRIAPVTGTSSQTVPSAGDSLPRDIPWVTQEVTARMKNSPVISADLGTPVEVFPIPAAPVTHSIHGTIMEFSLLGPHGKGHCQTLYVPAASSTDKKEHFVLMWTFNGKKKDLSAD